MRVTTRVFTNRDQDRLRRFISTQQARLAREAKDLARLSARAEHGSIVSPNEVPSDLVTMYSQIRVQDANTGRSCVTTVALPSEHEIHGADSLLRTYPAVELLGARVGDELAWSSAGREHRVRVEEILFQPGPAARGYDAVDMRLMDTFPASDAVARY